MSAGRPFAATQSSWINAWTLRRACAALGLDLRVQDERRTMPLPRLPAGAAAEWLFFTEERSLAQALASPPAGARFWPREFPAALLDDKWAFAAWLAEDRAGPQGLPQWPLAGAANARWPLLLKACHSWRGERKLPRGWVCRNAGELQAALARLPAAEHGWFFLQKWFGDASMRLVSVAGFFDAGDESRNLACVTERLADYGEGPSSSALLVTAADELGLVGSAEQVLRRLRYQGPYELEFIVAGGQAHVLELNPRFWMQHGLFLAAGNGLVKRYLGLESAADRAQRLLPPGLQWADGFWLLRRLLRADFGTLRRVCERRTVVCPGPLATLGAALWRLGGQR